MSIITDKISELKNNKQNFIELTEIDSDSSYNGAVRLSGTTNILAFDKQGPNGEYYKRITSNDGGGNYNIRAGSYFNGGIKTVDDNMGSANITMNCDGTDGMIQMYVSDIQDKDTDIDIKTRFDITHDGLLYNGVNMNKRLLPTAWIVGNLKDNKIYASYNISSMTEKATGRWEFVFSTSMDNDNYAIFDSANAHGDGGNAGGASYVLNDPKPGLTDKFQWTFREYDNTDYNKRWFSLIVYGGKN